MELPRQRVNGTPLTLVLTYKRLEAQRFVWPKLQSGTLALNPAQFEALFAGLDWQKVRAVSLRPPQVIA